MVENMKLIMSSTNGLLEQPTSNKQLADKNRQLISIFPDKCKALLDQLFKLNVSADQSKACSNLFYLLSFDAPLQTVFPEKLWTIFGKCYKELTMVKWILAEISKVFVRKLTLILVILFVSLITVIHSTMTHWYF